MINFLQLPLFVANQQVDNVKKKFLLMRKYLIFVLADRNAIWTKNLRTIFKQTIFYWYKVFLYETFVSEDPSFIFVLITLYLPLRARGGGYDFFLLTERKKIYTR